MDADHVLEHHTVVVRGERIERVGPAKDVAVPAGAMRIDARGLYLVPGLTDFHVHLNSPSDLASFLAFGVTTVAQLSGGEATAPDILGYKRLIAAGALVGPTIYASGPLIDASPLYNRVSVAADSPAAARALVASQKQAGYDMVKVYQRLKPDVFDALVAAAREQHIAVVGHVPDQVGLEHALRAGQVLVAHGVFFGVAVLDSAERYDLRKLPALVALARQRGVAVTPNIDAEFARLAVSEGGLDSIMSSPETKYLARPVESGWRAQTPEGVLRFAFPPKPAADFLMTLTKALADSGVLIVLGTDYPALPGLFPGLGVGDELSNFVRAGLTPFQALSAATRNPGVFVARHIAESERFGEVREGYRADFVLLRANPLVDVANTRRLNGVMVRGRWMPTEAITQLRQALTAQFR